MQDVLNGTAGHASAPKGPLPGRSSREELNAAVPGVGAARGWLSRELLDTRYVRAELLRLRGPGGGERSATNERRI